MTNRNVTPATPDLYLRKWELIVRVLGLVIVVALVWYLLVLVLASTYVSGSADKAAVAILAVSAAALRFCFVALKRYEHDWVAIGYLLSSVLPFLGASLSLAQGPLTALFILSLIALVITVALVVLDAKGGLRSVWMWQKRSWSNKKDDGTPLP